MEQVQELQPSTPIVALGKEESRKSIEPVQSLDKSIEGFPDTLANNYVQLILDGVVDNALIEKAVAEAAEKGIDAHVIISAMRKAFAIRYIIP